MTEVNTGWQLAHARGKSSAGLPTPPPHPLIWTDAKCYVKWLHLPHTTTPDSHPKHLPYRSYKIAFACYKKRLTTKAKLLILKIKRPCHVPIGPFLGGVLLTVWHL